jgi:two-component system chemotaxis response regulator CheB
MVLARDPQGWRVLLKDTPPVNFERPSVDVLMLSVAREAAAAAVGVILSGMGRDGAAGLLALRQAGGRTLAQDEESSVVYGMPREAWLSGAAERQLPLERMAAVLHGLLEGVSVGV